MLNALLEEMIGVTSDGGVTQMMTASGCRPLVVGHAAVAAVMTSALTQWGASPP